MIYTCPWCRATFAISDQHAGLVHQCAPTPIPVDQPAPSPAGRVSAATSDASSGRRDGGSGRPGPGAFQGSNRGEKPRAGTPIEPEKVAAVEGLSVSPADVANAKGWLSQVFYKKGALGKAEFFKLLDAAKAMGYEKEKDGQVRDWVKGLVDSGSEAAMAKFAKVLDLAGFIELEARKTAQAAEQAGKAQNLTAARAAILAFLKAHPEATLGDIQAEVPKATEKDVDALTDLGLIYQPKFEKWSVV